MKPWIIHDETKCCENMMNKSSGVFGIVFIAVLTSYVLKSLIQGGYFNPKIINHAPGPCRVFNVDGAEDVQILDNGIAFFSSGTKYISSVSCDPRILSRKGRIYLFDMNHPNQEPVELSLKSFKQTGFNPHGISLYKDRHTGVVSVFVINHRLDAQAIEIFDFDEKLKSLELRRSVVDDKIHSPNDLVAVGPDSFYVTNDHFFHFDKVFLRFIELLCLSVWLKSGVVYFDGKYSHDVAGSMGLANGIAQSGDGRFVFVSAGVQHAVNVYSKDDSGFLKLVQTMDIGTNVDNINVDKTTGDLWLGTIPNELAFVSYNENIDLPMPSQVVYVKLGDKDPNGPVPFPSYDLREVYLNNGSELKGATGADVYKDTLAVAAIFDKFMVCELKFY